jgi:hypothetical protein
MSLITLIDRIEPHASGWSRVRIRTLVQDAIDQLFEHDGPGTQFIPSDNEGFPPFLKTTDTVYQYDVITANLSTTLQKSLNGTNYAMRCNRVLKVFVDVTESDFDHIWTGVPYVYSPVSDYSTRDLTKIEVADIPADFIPANETDPAKVIFKDNPGTTTDKFYILFTWEHPRLTSESIPLNINSKWHEALMDYCIGRIQALSNGVVDNGFQQKFENKWKPEFRAAISGAIGRNNLQVQPIIC